MRRDPTRWINTLGFVSLLSLMSVVAVTSLTQMDSSIDHMSTLVEVSNAKISAANTMRDSIRQRSLIISNMRLTDDFFERDEMQMQLHRFAQNYITARARLIEATPNKDEQAIFEKLNKQVVMAQIATEELADALLAEITDKKIDEKFTEASKFRKTMLNMLDELVHLEEQIAHNALQDSSDYAKKIHDIVLIFSGIALAIGIIISTLVSRESTNKNLHILYQASHDELTHLVNRKEFENLLRRALETARKDKTVHVLCFLDLDHFKIINDTCGHVAGDRLLQNISTLLRKHTRKHDTLGRLGGDEFGLLLENCPTVKAAEIAEGLVGLVKNYNFVWEKRNFSVGVSIGLIPITHESESVARLMSQADMSCYAAKDMGRNRVHVHELGGSHITQMHNEMHWVANIRDSITENRFMLYVQPITPVADTTTSQHMYEVLLRLRDDDGNIVSAGPYIPAAERFGLMRDVDHWVLEKAFEYITHIYSTIDQLDLRLFINLSGNSFTDPEIRSMILDSIDLGRIPSRSVCFEITETCAVKDIATAVEFMNILKLSNCQIALDDFGSGMSSFTYLKNMPVDYLKLEGTIVNQMANNTIDHAMVAAMNQIGRIMNIKTIAEYVESAEIFNRLSAIGVDYAQGYHISKPFPIEDLEAILSTENRILMKHIKDH